MNFTTPKRNWATQPVKQGLISRARKAGEHFRKNGSVNRARSLLHGRSFLSGSGVNKIRFVIHEGDRRKKGASERKRGRSRARRSTGRDSGHLLTTEDLSLRYLDLVEARRAFPRLFLSPIPPFHGNLPRDASPSNPFTYWDENLFAHHFEFTHGHRGYKNTQNYRPPPEILQFDLKSRRNPCSSASTKRKFLRESATIFVIEITRRESVCGRVPLII